ncbi:MAG: glycosyltransferase family 2 protein [Actinomycetota bacterium]|nr:glycosyltransferase family 2 protein [Actinomycetota bacterium]
MRATDFSYVLPVRWSGGEDESRRALSEYLDQVVCWCDDVIVVDGSPPEIFAANASLWSGRLRHVAPDPAHQCLMGKVSGVLTGIDLAHQERVVMADDDVRYDRSSLTRIVAALDHNDLVRPQNYFAPMPWHAVWDTSRTLLNRATGTDFPGTLGLRRSTVLSIGGYSGDVMFENLELIRTVEAHGGRVFSPLNLFVRRLPPSSAHFWGQRTRQAYDDFALPVRMSVWLGVLPAIAAALLRRQPRPVALAAAACMLLAERGRRRSGGADVFPWASSILAPVWVIERGTCAWLAAWQRARFGGVRYGDSTIRVAAHSPRHLRRQASARLKASLR